ncbi:hypothetical protein D9M68_689700 [compost metagenome]
MHVADGAACEAGAVGRGRQLARADQVGRFVGVEGQRELELAIGQHAVHFSGAGREGLAAAPELRVQLVQISPQRRRGRGETGRRHRRLQQFSVGREFNQHLLDEGRAVKVGQLGVTHASRVGLGKCQQLGRRTRRRRRLGLVGDEGQLRCAPGGFKTFRGHREVAAHGLVQVHRTPVGQALSPGTEQQTALLQVAEVFAVDPDEIHRAVGAAPGGHFGLHPLDHLGRVRHLHMTQLHPIAALDLLRHPADVGVRRLAAAPGVEIHRLAFGIGLHLGPVGVRGEGERQAQRQGGEGQAFHVQRLQRRQGCEPIVGRSRQSLQRRPLHVARTACRSWNSASMRSMQRMDR